MGIQTNFLVRPLLLFKLAFCNFLNVHKNNTVIITKPYFFNSNGNKHDDTSNEPECPIFLTDNDKQ